MKHYLIRFKRAILSTVPVFVLGAILGLVISLGEFLCAKGWLPDVFAQVMAATLGVTIIIFMSSWYEDMDE